MRGTGRSGPWLGLTALLLASTGASARAQSVEDLRQMSIDDLANIDVTSATKTALPLSGAPAAMYVITHDDIIRSGAETVAEMLRLAPNLMVAQTSAGRYVITSRGFSGNNQAQAFSDKLLVLIDGRSVYSPLFSGVYWDSQDVLPGDVDRIEVISGPGATLWGANAVNGVINIITRKAVDTQGVALEVVGGDQLSGASVRVGGRLGETVAWRLYAKDFRQNNSLTSAGSDAHDHMTLPQGGFRLDWTATGDDLVTVQGDAYSAAEAQASGPDEDAKGGNLQGRWTHAWRQGSSLQVQAYYDRVERGGTSSGGHFTVDTYDLDVQHSFQLGARNAVVVGGGVRRAQYAINGSTSLLFVPPKRALDLSNLFAQDSIALGGDTTLILGLKVEDDAYVGATLLPSARVAWKPNERTLLWSAVSRAIRSPTPFDRDVVEKLGSTVFLAATGFRSETLTAYEAGARLEPLSRLSLSVSAYYNLYDDLRTIEPAAGGFLPLYWGNKMRGHTWGLEAWGDYRVTPWWRLSASLNLLRESLRFKPGASGVLGLAQAGDDPGEQASLRSSMTLGDNVTLDGDLRYVSALPNPAVPSYVELGARLAWNVDDHLQLAVTGANLLHDHHQEFPGPAANAVPRSVYAQVRWRY